MHATYIAAVAWAAGIGGITLAVVPSITAWARQRRQTRTSR